MGPASGRIGACLTVLAMGPGGCGDAGNAVRGCVQSEVRTLSRAGLSSLELVAAAGLRVLARRGEAVVGEGVTGTDGCFEVPVVQAEGALRVELRAVTVAPEGGRWVLGVGHAEETATPTYWRWTSDGDPACGAPPIALSLTSAGGAQLDPWILREPCGSGAVAAFTAVREAMSFLDPALSPLGGRPVPSLALLWSPGVKGDCSACFFEGPSGEMTIEADSFDTRIHLSGRSDTPAHWSRSVIAHEVGHWAMHAYSRSPQEKGLHAFGTPLSPGLAYKEGWATAFGQRVLGKKSGTAFDPLYLTMQLNQVIWVDLLSLQSTFGPLELPVPDRGVTQPLDEFVVAAALWRLWMKHGALSEPSLGLGDPGIRALLASERLRGRLDRGHPGPDLLDALDACVCTQQATSAELAHVLSPLRYPWDGAAACE